jgi:hypothetical protein
MGGAQGECLFLPVEFVGFGQQDVDGQVAGL